ncbi:MAG: HEAT repeat domain-containing protein [Planctomycetota bacterium]
MKRFFLIAVALGVVSFFAEDVLAHGGSFRGPNGGVPPGLREPSDPEPPPPPPTDPGAPGGPTTPGPGGGGPETPDDNGHETPSEAPPPPPTGPQGPERRGPATKTLTFESWRFWWAYNNDDILNLKSHIYGAKTSSASPLFFTSKADEANRRNAQRPTERAIINKIIPALKRSLNRPKDHEDIHGGSLVALGKIGTSEFVPDFEAAANNRWKTEKGVPVKFGYLATESAVLALGLLPNLDDAQKAEVRKILLTIIDDDKMRSRERAWAAVCLGLQEDKGAIKPLWERLAKPYKGENKLNVPAGILCGLGLIGDDSIRPDLEELVVTGKVGRTELNDRIRAYAAFALAKIASPESLESMNKALKSRRVGRVVKRSIAIACGTCAQNASPELKDATVKALRAFIKKSGGDPSGENFAIIALSQIGTPDALNYLLNLADSGKYGQRPYAALGLGTHVWYKERAKERKEGEGMDPAMMTKIRNTIVKLSQKYKDTDTKAAFMLTRGLLKDKTAIEECVKLITRKGDPVLRGFCCVALGLIGEATENVKDALKIALAERKSTDLRRDAATALGLMRDADVVKMLIEELDKSKSFAVQGQLITAIGTIGDHTAIDPLIDILDNTSRPSAARALAAVGLGMIGDLLPLARLSRLSKNYNYRASVKDLDELLFIL